MQIPSLEVKDNDQKITAEIFTTDAIRTHPELQFSQADYFLIAVLSGGDYNKVIEYFTYTL
jgi:hypothetical protein